MNLIPVSRSTPNQLYKVVKTADNRFDKKDYKKSLDGYKKALTMKPNKEIESHCYLKIGLSLQSLENYSEALSSFDKSISIQKSFMGFFYKGILLMKLSKYKDAEDSLKHALKLNTNDNNAVVTYINLGKVYILSDKIKDAIKTLNSALEIKKNEITALLLLAEAYKQLKDIEKAKELYEQILTHKQDKDAVMSLALIYLDEDQQQKAISLLKNYLQDHPDAELYVVKGDIHFGLHDYENALMNFKKARKLENSEKHLLREAQVLLALNKFEDAETDVLQYIHTKKETFSATLFLAEVYAKNKQSDKASELLNELIQTNQKIRTNPQLSQLVGNVLLLNREYDKAENLFLHANDMGLQDWNITKQLAIIAIETKKYDKALEIIEKLFSLAQSSSQIGHSFYLKAHIYFKQENYTETVNALEEGMNQLKKSKNDQYYILMIMLAKTKLKMNLTSETEKIIHQALDENPDLKKILESDSELSSFLN